MDNTTFSKISLLGLLALAVLVAALPAAGESVVKRSPGDTWTVTLGGVPTTLNVEQDVTVPADPQSYPDSGERPCLPDDCQPPPPPPPPPPPDGCDPEEPDCAYLDGEVDGDAQECGQPSDPEYPCYLMDDSADPASTPETVHCKTAWAAANWKLRATHHIIWRYIQEIRWCYDGMHINSVMRLRGAEVHCCFWEWVGHVMNSCASEHCSEQAGHYAVTISTKGKFRGCVAGRWVFCREKFPLVWMRIRANGTWSWGWVIP